MCLQDVFNQAGRALSVRLALKTTTIDAMQNVQRTCMGLRLLLKNPRPNVYGTVTIRLSYSKKTFYTVLNFQELSEWLTCRAPGDTFKAIDSHSHQLADVQKSCKTHRTLRRFSLAIVRKDNLTA